MTEDEAQKYGEQLRREYRRFLLGVGHSDDSAAIQQMEEFVQEQVGKFRQYLKEHPQS